MRGLRAVKIGIAGAGLVGLLLLSLIQGLRAQHLGFDTGDPLPSLAGGGRRFGPGWRRIRGLPDPADAPAESFGEARRQLTELHGRGCRICVLLPCGLEPVARKGEASVVVDLRQTKERFLRFGRAYRGLVDAWEIGNEPDLGASATRPEHYGAVFKAAALGIHQAGSPAVSAGLALPGALGLPPGPYFVRLLDDGILSYADGINFHFYGFAEDLPGEYAQLEDAVESVGQAGSVNRSMPVFLTECGYAIMDGATAATAAGRARQRDWFERVASEVSWLRIEAPMMFILRPYCEEGLIEFGLEMPDQTDSPALGYLRARTAHDRYPSRNWRIRAWSPSPIVIDFAAGAGTTPADSWGGYALSGTTGEAMIGEGCLRIYNLTNAPIRGRLTIGDPCSGCNSAEEMVLTPGELKLRPVRLVISRAPWNFHPWMVKFDSDTPEATQARFSTELYPAPESYCRILAKSLDFQPAAADRHAAMLRSQAHALEEPVLAPEGRWCATSGIRIEESADAWKFTVDEVPAAVIRPASVELPLPKGFAIHPNEFLRLEFRCQQAGQRFSRYARFSGAIGGILRVQIRTENGNLYEVLPRQSVRTDWSTYEMPGAAYTLSFFGRTNPPWRFSANRPAALVLTFWPRSLPTTVQIRPVGVIRLEWDQANDRARPTERGEATANSGEGT